MVITTTATNLQNNFERYLKNVQRKNKVSRLISKDTSTSFLTDSLTGILKNDYNEKDIIAEKYEGIFLEYQEFTTDQIARALGYNEGGDYIV